MSKNTKEKQRNKPLRKPTSTAPPGSLSKLLNINPMYLLGVIGVVIAGVSLWYQRKSYLKDEDEQQSDDKQDEGPKHSSGGESNFFGPTRSDLRTEVTPPVQKKSAKGKEKQESAQQKHFDPFEWKKHKMGVWTFDD